MGEQPMDLKPLFDGIFGKQRTVLMKGQILKKENWWIC